MTRSSFAYITKERLGIPLYTRPQTYRVTLDLFLENKGKEPADSEVCVPIPQTADTQTVEEESFSRPVEFFHDSAFGNRVALWKEQLRVGERAGLQAIFLVAVTPSGKHGNANNRAKEKYLEKNRFFESTDAREVAQSILPTESDSLKIARAFNRYTVANFTYGNPITGLYSAHDAFEKRVVDCGGFDTALCALCVARGIPARIVSGFWAGQAGREQMHAWCEVLMNNQWVPTDPSIEYLVREGRDRTKSGRFGFVGSDRIIFSVGCDIPLPHDSSADILQHPFLLTPSKSLTFSSAYHAQIL